MFSIRTLCITFALLATANVFVYRGFFASSVSVTRLDVGKEKMVLVELPAGRAIVVGGGADAGVLRALGGALPPWQRRISALVLLDTSAAGEGGAPFVLGRYRVGQLLRPAERGSKAREDALAAAASASGTLVTEIPLGDRVVLRYGSLTLPLSASTTTSRY